jgi:hypothetical protein
MTDSWFRMLLTNSQANPCGVTRTKSEGFRPIAITHGDCAVTRSCRNGSHNAEESVIEEFDLLVGGEDPPVK